MSFGCLALFGSCRADTRKPSAFSFASLAKYPKGHFHVQARQMSFGCLALPFKCYNFITSNMSLILTNCAVFVKFTRFSWRFPPFLFQIIPYILRLFYNCFDFSTQASTAPITLPRSPISSSVCTPSIVVPPGEQTISFSSPGCFPVSSKSFALPITLCAARR